MRIVSLRSKSDVKVQLIYLIYPKQKTEKQFFLTIKQAAAQIKSLCKINYQLSKLPELNLNILLLALSKFLAAFI